MFLLAYPIGVPRESLHLAHSAIAQLFDVPRVPMMYDVSVNIVLCIGSPEHASGFQAFSRLGKVDFPASRGEVVLCPIDDDTVIPTVVVETRIGGGLPVLALHSDESFRGSIAELLFASPRWKPLRTATAMKGEVLGVFLNHEESVEDDILGLDSWPVWEARHTNFMISLGILGSLPEVKVEGIDTPRICRHNTAGLIYDSGFALASSVEEECDYTPHTWIAEETPIPTTSDNVVDLSEWRTANR